MDQIQGNLAFFQNEVKQFLLEFRSRKSTTSDSINKLSLDTIGGVKRLKMESYRLSSSEKTVRV